MAVLTYDLQVTGLAAVEAAMGKVEGMLARVNAATGYTRNGRERTSGTYATTLNKTAASGAQLQRQADKAAKDAERRAAQEARAAAQSAKAVERAEKQKTKALEQEAAKRERIRSQEAKDQARASANQERQAKRAEQAQSAAAQRTGTSRYNRLAGIAGGAWGTVRNAGVMALGAAGLGGGALFATAVHSQMSAMAAASKLANQFSENGATVDSIRATKHDLLKEAGGVRGYTSEEALGAMSKYHEKTGEAGSARRMVKKLGDLSLASGANIEDVSEFGSIIHNVLKTKGIGTAEAEPMVYDLLKNAAAVAKEKSIELRDFARVGGSVIAQAPLLTGDVASNAKLGMSITQMAIAGGATSPEEAATSYQNMIADMVKHQKQLKGMGIKDSIKGGKLDLAGTLGQVLEKTNGDIDKAMKVFNIRGLRAFTGLGVAYKTAEESQKGSGRSAVMGELARLSGATLTEETIKAGVTSRMEDPDMQWKEAQKKLNAAIGKELVPVITRMIPKLAEAAPALGRFAAAIASAVDFFAKNPFESLGILVSGAILKEIASAAIADQIKSLMTRILTGAGAPGAAGGTGGGAGANIGAAAAIVATAVLSYEGGKAFIGGQFDAKQKEHDADFEVTRAVAGGSLEERKKALVMARKREAEIAKGTGADQTSNFFAWLSGDKSLGQLSEDRKDHAYEAKRNREELEYKIQREETGGELPGFSTTPVSNPLGIGKLGPAAWSGSQVGASAAPTAPEKKETAAEAAAKTQVQAAEKQLEAARQMMEAARAAAAGNGGGGYGGNQSPVK